MPQGYIARNVSDAFGDKTQMHKLFVYEVHDYNAGINDTLIKQKANNFKSLKKVLNLTKNDDHFKGMYYDPNIDLYTLDKNDQETNVSLSLTTSYVFQTNDDLSFLQDSKKLYVFTKQKEFDKDSIVYILKGTALRTTTESQLFDQQQIGNFSARSGSFKEMWSIGLQEISKIQNDEQNTIFFDTDPVPILAENATKRWIDRDVVIGVEPNTLIYKIEINGDIEHTINGAKYENIILPMKVKSGYLFPTLAQPVLISNDVNMYFADFESDRLTLDDIIHCINVIDSPSIWTEPDSDGWMDYNETPITISKGSTNFYHYFFPTTEANGAIWVDKDKGILNYKNPIDLLVSLIYATSYFSINPDQIKGDSRIVGTLSDMTDLAFQKFQYEIIMQNTINSFKLDRKNKVYWNFIKLACAFSGSINSPNLCVGGGQNDVVKALLPFYFYLNRIVTEDDDWSNIEFIPKSARFKIRKNNISGEIKMWPRINRIDSDIYMQLPTSEITFPVLPDNLNDEVQNNTNLSKINLSNNDWLKYFVYIATNDISKFNDLFEIDKEEETNEYTVKLKETHKSSQTPISPDINYFKRLLPPRSEIISYEITSDPVKQITVPESCGTRAGWILILSDGKWCTWQRIGTSGYPETERTAQPYHYEYELTSYCKIKYTAVEDILLNPTETHIYNSGEYIKARQIIDPQLNSDRYVNITLTLDEVFGSSDWAITKINSIIIKNIWGVSQRKEIKYWFQKDSESPQSYTKIIEDEPLYSQYDEKNCKTTTIL